MQIEFDWDPAKAAINARKHGVQFKDVIGIFNDPLARSLLDRSPDINEERWVMIGEDRSENIVVIVHTYEAIDERYARVRIISARRATRVEARQYREGEIQ